MGTHVHSYIRPGAQVVLKLPSGILKPVGISPDTIISIGKFGSFPSNAILGRPYHLTYEILDLRPGEKQARLRIVPASELHAESISASTETAVENETNGGAYGNGGGGGGNNNNNNHPNIQDTASSYKELATSDGRQAATATTATETARNNRLTVDDPARQALSMTDIEALKRDAADTGGGRSGREVIARIMAAHSGLDEKTVFSLAKYARRKSSKYMRRFTVLPMDVGVVVDVVLEKEAARIMDLREETLGLITSWANVRHAVQGGRWLVVDDTGGLLVAAMAEKMGLLYPNEEDPVQVTDAQQNGYDNGQEDEIRNDDNEEDNNTTQSQRRQQKQRPNPKGLHQSATSNSITLVHANAQPNISILKYFSYVPEEASSAHHPLYTNLRSLSWLQLIDPEADQLYHEPQPVMTESELAGLKSGKRSTYFRKRRRWQRIKRVADDTRQGGFDGCVVATHMRPDGVLRQLVPLVRGGGNIVVYSPNVEPLTELMDVYSRERRGAYLRLKQEQCSSSRPKIPEQDEEDEEDDNDDDYDDFPVDPTLVLNPALQTARARAWQVLPGRTHPLMTSRGGPEGYIFTATRVLPMERRIEARGKFGRKRKAEEAQSQSQSQSQSHMSKRGKTLEAEE